MNIGNSCFMNSIIQCLSNTAILRDYFLSNGYVSDINKKNPLGFKGDLAQSFAGIIRKLWTPDQTSFSPRQLKNVIAGKSKHFGGYQQQDSHEFMSYLLDGLHEDLNRVQEKPSTSRVETDGNDDLSDTQLADMAWQVYLQRNDSYFVDHFQGQFKSTLVCPVCQKVSELFVCLFVCFFFLYIKAGVVGVEGGGSGLMVMSGLERVHFKKKKKLY